MAMFELFVASIPRRNLSGWNQPIRFLEPLAYWQIRESSSFLEANGMAFGINWYGDPNPGFAEVKFRLYLTITNPTHAMIFRLWSGLEEVETKSTHDT
jgi:hypothetical protein